MSNVLHSARTHTNTAWRNPWEARKRNSQGTQKRRVRTQQAEEWAQRITRGFSSLATTIRHQLDDLN